MYQILKGRPTSNTANEEFFVKDLDTLVKFLQAQEGEETWKRCEGKRKFKTPIDKVTLKAMISEDSIYLELTKQYTVKSWVNVHEVDLWTC